MPNDYFSQQALAVDANFRQRVKGALSTVAWQVLNEASNTANHTVRAAYARVVIQNVDAAAIQVAPWLVMRTNVLAATTSYDFQRPAVVSAVTDASIESQLSTDWSLLAGV